MNRVLKIAAGLTAFLVFMIVMVIPLVVVRVLSGMPLNAQGPSWQVWLVVLGGGIGAAAARLSHDLILKKVGGLNEKEIENNWRGK